MYNTITSQDYEMHQKIRKYIKNGNKYAICFYKYVKSNLIVQLKVPKFAKYRLFEKIL